MKNIYFLSDAHLGCRALQHERQRERRLVRFLEQIRDRAEAVYMLGDMFDFWHEYPTVVPRGFTRFLGALSALTDAGVEVHYFTGNHDIWAYNYLAEECSVILHHEPATLSLGDKTFYLGHGDGLGDPDWKFRLIQGIFHNRVCQWLFKWLHPTIGINFGLEWARRSRIKHDPALGGGDPDYLGENKEHLVIYAKDYLRKHPDINYFLFGHRHIELDLMLSHHCRMLILGDWITQCTYVVWDGEHLFMENYVEGDTQP